MKGLALADRSASLAKSIIDLLPVPLDKKAPVEDFARFQSV